MMRFQSYPNRLTLRDSELHVIPELRHMLGKWSVEIVSYLVRRKDARFEELRKALSGVSPRVLSSKLSVMEDAGFIRRTVVETKPPAVRYELTQRGVALASLGRPTVLFLINEKLKESHRR